MTSGDDLPDFLLENDEIDRMIEERAGAFNLTGTNIRNILYHVVLGAGGARQLWDEDFEEEPTLEIPEPKTRAAKQRMQDGGKPAAASSTSAAPAPVLALPELKSEDEEEEEDDQDYTPHDTESSDESDPEAPPSVKSQRRNSQHKASECESDGAPPTPASNVGLAKRTRSLYSLKDRELPELEQDLPEDEVVEEGNLDTIPEDDDSVWGDWKNIEEELGTEYDAATAEEGEEEGEESDHAESEEESGAAADDGTFGRFLHGISNPREEFPEVGDGEEEEEEDAPYRFREPAHQEAEEFRTDKEVVVTKKEMEELLRDLDKSHPALKVQVNCKRLPRHKPNPTTGEGMRFEDVPAVEPEPLEIVEWGPLFKPEALRVLKEQLHIHLQLLVQHCILAKGWEFERTTYPIAMAMIEDLEELKSNQSTEGLIQALGDGGESEEEPFDLVGDLDIYTAIRLARGEKVGKEVEPAKNLPRTVIREVRTNSFLSKHLKPLPPSKYALLNFQPFFHSIFHIRPVVDFCPRKPLRQCFSESEDNLLAHGLDSFQHFDDQRIVYNLIQDHFLPNKSSKQIMNRMKNNCSKVAPRNVVKHWRETGQIKYDTNLSVIKVMKVLTPTQPGAEYPPLRPAVKIHNLEWLMALREHKRKMKRELKSHNMNCSKEEILETTRLSTEDPSHSHEMSFLLKAKEVLKDDDITYFNVFKLLAEYDQRKDFDCNEMIQRMLEVLKSYPELGVEFLSIFSPLPDLPLSQLLETLNHVQARLLLRNLELHFKANPVQYRKVLKMILGADMSNPDVTRDALLSMLRGKAELCQQVADFFDRCMVRPKAHEFEFIDLTNPTAEPTTDGFEEVTFLDKAPLSVQKHNELVRKINEFHDGKRKEEKERLEKEEQEKRKRKIEPGRLYANNIVECGDKTVTWTRDEDRAILKACRKKGPRTKVLKSLAKTLEDKNESQIKDRYEELIKLMKRAESAAKQAAYREKMKLQAAALHSSEPPPAKKPRLESRSDSPKPGPSTSL